VSLSDVLLALVGATVREQIGENDERCGAGGRRSSTCGDGRAVDDQRVAFDDRRVSFDDLWWTSTAKGNRVIDEREAVISSGAR
jgi:hypothetical protein